MICLEIECAGDEWQLIYASSVRAQYAFSISRAGRGLGMICMTGKSLATSLIRVNESAFIHYRATKKRCAQVCLSGRRRRNDFRLLMPSRRYIYSADN